MTRLLLGDNIESLKKLEDNSIDSIVSDPPYGLSFMGKKWDYDVPSVEFWREVYRVLKPGGHVLSFGGTRTYHRMAVNIEDAGFEIRDQIMWLYGSGFPKSHNIGKSVDKVRGNDREVVGISAAQRLNKRVAAPSIDMNGREVLETKGTSEWEGWGTALKPANEPICLARKPLSEKTIVDNVLRWGTGGINIDGCRVTMKEGDKKVGGFGNAGIGYGDVENNGDYKADWVEKEEGRFPANIILDEEAGQALDEQSGISKSNTKNSIKDNDANIFNDGENKKTGHKNKIYVGDYSDKGGASRFFYQAKVGKKERNMGLDAFEEKQSRMKNNDDSNTDYKNEKVAAKYQAIKAPAKNNHPTVKPVSLMAYLCRLITPPNGIVLDPFMGSGSTGIAARLEGFRFAGMEMDEDYFKIAKARIEDYEKYREFLKK
jgi:DNA modification methylase